jgi:hypothetical protein
MKYCSTNTCRHIRNHNFNPQLHIRAFTINRPKAKLIVLEMNSGLLDINRSSLLVNCKAAQKNCIQIFIRYAEVQKSKFEGPLLQIREVFFSPPFRNRVVLYVRNIGEVRTKTAYGRFCSQSWARVFVKLISRCASSQAMGLRYFSKFFSQI